MTGIRIVMAAFTLAWLSAVGARFRHSKPVLIGGLAIVGVMAVAAMLADTLKPAAFGLSRPNSWLLTVVVASAWVLVMLAYSPLADAFARRRFPDPPDLTAFDGLRRSRARLVVGIAVAWLLGGFLEELTFRGVVLQVLDTWLTPVLPRPVAAAAAILAAAAGAAVIHLYQGSRAVLVVGQLSVLFGTLMVLGGHNLWTVMICHGLYDTVAFIRYARGTSRYATANRQPTE
jgi:membrane protease YdiL (CAAX protease family)